MNKDALDLFDLYRYLKWQSFAYGPFMSSSIEVRKNEEGEDIVVMKFATTVKNEVGDRFKTTAEGKPWWQYKATVHVSEDQMYEFYWYVWQATDEPKEYLKDFGFQWNGEELEEGSTPEAGKVRFYRDGKPVGELEWLFVSVQHWLKMDLQDLYHYLMERFNIRNPVISLEKREGEKGEKTVVARIVHVVKNEVGATAEDELHWRYNATVYDMDKRIVSELYWYTRQATNEPREFLRSCSFNWDKEELEEGSTPEAGKACLYKDGKLVGELSWSFV